MIFERNKKLEEKKVEVCENCSGLDIAQLKKKVKINTGCIGKCSRKFPELNGKVYGFLNGEFTVCDTKEEFLAKIDALSPYLPGSGKNPKVDAFLSKAEHWKPEFERLREIVLDCGLTEDLKWGEPCYTLNNSNVVMLGAFKNYISLSFFKGVLLQDPKHILVALTKNIQAARLLKFTNVQEIDSMESVLKAYIHEAIRVEQSGLKVVKKDTVAEIPQELLNKFHEMPRFQDAFEALTPGRQRGYILYFSAAKQSKTRESRIEKCMDKIFDGIGVDE